MKILGYGLKIGYERFFTHRIQFEIHSNLTTRPYTTRAVVKRL